MDDFSLRLAEVEKKVDAIYKSVEQTRKIFLASLILSVAFVVLPIIGLVILIPKVISMYSNLGL